MSASNIVRLIEKTLSHKTSVVMEAQKRKIARNLLKEATPKNADWAPSIINALARMFYVTAWADREEEKGRTYGGHNIMDVAPSNTPAKAKAFAAKYAVELARANSKSLDELLNDAAQADKTAPSLDYAENFGHDLALQALGHGVSWFDDHAQFELKVPSTEFSL